MNQLTYIYNARIVDGTGSPAFAGSLLFDHNEILAVRPGPVMDLPADVRRIDAGGRTVTPGFIDIHRHPDAEPLQNSRFGETMLRQGITTTVVGNCGISLTPAPADALVRKSMADYYKRISNELNIVKGKTERELNYKYRIIYSAVGRMAYASLWDTLEDYDLVVDKVME